MDVVKIEEGAQYCMSSSSMNEAHQVGNGINGHSGSSLGHCNHIKLFRIEGCALVRSGILQCENVGARY